MLKLHKRVFAYNLTNILGTIILGFFQILMFTGDNLWLYALMADDGEELIVLIFWPILVLFGVIAFNKKLLRVFIHKQNQEMYVANNVHLDTKADKGSLPNDFISKLPSSTIKSRVKKDMSADMIFSGTLDDIGLRYKIDNFNYRVSYRVGDDTKYAIRMDGDALIAELDQDLFGDDYIMYIGTGFKAKKLLINFDEFEDLTDVGLGLLCFNTKSAKCELIKSTIESNQKFFENNGQVIAGFKNNQFILMTDKAHKFKIKLPYIIHKARLETIIDNQRAQVYRFNQFLVDITRMFN